MTLPLTLLWIVIVSSFAVASAYYARRYDRTDGIVALFVTLVILSNIFAGKAIAFDLGFGTFFAPGSVLIFSITFLLTDIVNEYFGRRETQRMIFLGLICQVALIIFSYLVLKADAAPFFMNQAAFEAVLGNAPRIFLAGLVAFFVSENMDAYLFAWLKRLTGGKHLWMRNAFSSIPSMLADSAIFVVLAFYGTFPIIPLIIGLTFTKWIVAVVDIPFMYLSRAVLRK